jgi:acetyl-CoA acetyltransferase
VSSTFAPGLVRDDRVIADADRAQAAGQRAQGVADLVRLGRADRVRAGGVDELLLVQRVVAAQQNQGEHAVQEVDQGLDLAFGRGLVAGREILDGPYPGSVEGLRGRESHGPFG